MNEDGGFDLDGGVALAFIMLCAAILSDVDDDAVLAATSGVSLGTAGLS